MKKQTNLKTLLVISVLLALAGFTPAVAVGGTIYVDVNTPDNNDGSSWAKAYKYLQDALSDAQVSGDDIWVAAGTYYPDANSTVSGSNDPAATFQLINGVSIYGGFSGGETILNQRDWETNKTILSGDIGVEEVETDNSHHVVTASNTDSNTFLDGFTITDGYARGSGAMEDTFGGGMFNEGGSPRISNCLFTNNFAWNWGGGMFNDDASPTIDNCIFVSNFAQGYGGAMYNGNPFQSNQTYALVTNCTFVDNSCETEGGAVSNSSDSSTDFFNCKFFGNTAIYISGGGLHNQGNATMTNCIFSGNSTGNRGGAVCNDIEGIITLTNCTLSSNSADDIGGGLHNLWSSEATMRNCIVWGNTSPVEPQIYNVGTITVSRSNVQDGYEGTSNIDEDPGFTDADGSDDIIGTEDDNLRLAVGSPCIDAGDNGAITEAADLDGHPRLVDGGCDGITKVDMGAYEFSFVYIGDFDGDCDVDFGDFTIFALAWLTESGDIRWNPMCNISIPADSSIDGLDLEVFADNWLQRTMLYELTASVRQGNGAISPTSGGYEQGTVVTLIATPEPGYGVKAWTGTDKDSSTANSNTVSMDSDKTVSVEFHEAFELLVNGNPAPTQLILMSHKAASIGLRLRDGGNCNSYNLSFSLSNPDVGSFDASTITFPAPFDIYGVREIPPDYVEIQVMAVQPGFPVSGPAVLINDLTFSPVYFGCTTLEVRVINGTVINGQTIPPGTVLCSMPICVY